MSPTKDLTAISIPQSMTRIIATLQATDASARLIMTNEYGNEKEFIGAKSLPLNTEKNQEFARRYIEDLKINKKNELIRLITLRSHPSRPSRKTRGTSKDSANNP